MRSALLGGLVGAVVAAGVLLGAGVVDDDEPSSAAAPPAATQTQTSPQGDSAREESADTDVGRIYEQAAPATVSVLRGGGSGTGFLVDAEGTIVTNAHVVGGASSVTIRFGEEGERIRGRVRGSDPGSDLAVVRIPPAEIPAGTEPLEIADSDEVGVGDVAVAIGNPFGQVRTATVGIVSAVGRTITAPNEFSIAGAIQTDASINPGNSGGPLLDARARVIGVNSQIETTTGSNTGVGFAVPSNTVRDVVPDLLDDGRLRRGFLGVSTGEPAEGTGALVRELTAGGPAAGAGVRAGDVVVALDGRAIDTPDDVTAAISTKRAGDTVELRVRRGGQERTIRVELGEQPRRVATAG